VKAAQGPPTELTPQQMADRMGELKPLADEYEALKKRVRSEYDARLLPAQETTIEGANYLVVIGRKKNQRRLTNLSKLFTRLGKLKFLDFCSFTLEALKRSGIPEAEHGTYVIEELNTGSRDITVHARSTAKAA
jgi:hypothetical protein